MEKLKSFEISKGVNLRLLKSEKFKTNIISVIFHLPLMRETVTRAALIPRVLKRGSEKYPTLADLSRRAEELYGASISAGVVKKGDVELIKFTASSVSDNFLSESITEDVVDLIYQTVFCPKTVNGGFDSEYVRQEKENAKNFIEGLVNDKKEYARVKCDEIMFGGDPYGIFEYGFVSDLAGIDEKNLYEFYKEIIANSRVDIFVGGSFAEEKIKSLIEDKLGGVLKAREAADNKTAIAELEENIEVKRVTEEMPVTQSKLVMGFNCGVDPLSDEYYALMLFSCIYGGSPFSKLFNNVREKLSLAYYVFSSVDRQKSLMRISSGIEAGKFDAAYDEIMLQLDKMKNGEFSDDEIESAKKYLTTGLNSAKDSLSSTESFYIGQLIMGKNETIDEVLASVYKVDRSRIIAIANKIQLDTVYFLKGVTGNEV